MSYTPMFDGGVSCYGGTIPYAPAPIFEGYPYQGNPATIPYADPQSAPNGNPSLDFSRQGLRPAGFSGAAGTVVAAAPGARATVIVRLPLDARLFADGVPLRMTGGERKFVTPELPNGMEYSYRMTAEYERSGEVVSVSKKVAVRAGGSVAIEFTDLTAARPTSGGKEGAAGRAGEGTPATPVSNTNTGAGSVVPVAPSTPPTGVDVPPPPSIPSGPTAQPAETGVASRATITVKMPAGATLYVDNRKSPSNEAIRRFTTPPLPAGREFAYLLKAEVVRGGQPEQLIQKIAFRAGEQVVVDFTTFGNGR